MLNPLRNFQYSIYLEILLAEGVQTQLMGPQRIQGFVRLHSFPNVFW